MSPTTGEEQQDDDPRHGAHGIVVVEHDNHDGADDQYQVGQSQDGQKHDRYHDLFLSRFFSWIYGRTNIAQMCVISYIRRSDSFTLFDGCAHLPGCGFVVA